MIITVASFKGGVGKTTTAIHLSQFLSKLGTTVLADGDLNRSACNWASRANTDQDFRVVDRDEIEGVDFEHLVIDTPARPDEATLSALAESSDILLIPTTPATFALEALIATLAVIPGAGYQIVLTAVPPYPSKEGDKARDALSNLGFSVCKSQIRRYAAYQKSEKMGVTVGATGDKNARIAWSDYESLGKEIMND